MSIKPYEDGTVTVEAQGPYAPETLMSEVYSRRFIGTPRDRGEKYLIITDYYAVVQVGPEADPMYQVINCTEFHHTNSLDEEGDCDYAWEDEDWHETIEEADRDARAQLDSWNIGFWLPNFKDEEADE